jgi:hypothetical protein
MAICRLVSTTVLIAESWDRQGGCPDDSIVRASSLWCSPGQALRWQLRPDGCGTCEPACHHQSVRYSLPLILPPARKRQASSLLVDWAALVLVWLLAVILNGPH